MGEEEQGNLDSFVDIIANTAGIMIVLVVMSLMNSNKAGSVGNMKLIELSKLNSNITDLQKNMPDKAKKTLVKKKHREARATLEHGLKQLNLEGADSAHIRETLRDKGKANVVKRERLDKLTTEEQEALRGQEEASRETGALVALDEQEFLRDKDIGDMRDELDKVEQKTLALKKSSTTLAGEKTGLEGVVAALKKEIEILETQGGATLEVGGPMTRIARERQAVWAECFMPKKSLDADGVPRPCVRLVSVTGYAEKEEGTLHLKTQGESTFQILKKDSDFQKFLTGKSDEDRATLYLMFVVRPDAYSAFRLARKIAADDHGWKVRWRPIAAGNEMAFPGRAPPATTARDGAARDERTITWAATTDGYR